MNQSWFVKTIFGKIANIRAKHMETSYIFNFVFPIIYYQKALSVSHLLFQKIGSVLDVSTKFCLFRHLGALKSIPKFKQ